MNNKSVNSKNKPKKYPTLDLKPSHTLQKELRNLAVKTLIIIVGAWIVLYIFEIFAAPSLGFKHSQIQVVKSVIIITIAFVIITATRRILKNFSNKIERQFSAGISFFIILFISLIASILILYQWDVNPQEILVGGGVAAIVLGIGVSTIIGNILSGGLMLTTFPAKIGDSIFIVNDDVHGKIEEVTMLYTKISTDQGTEYIVPNNAIIQGTIRITKEKSLLEHLPFTDGDHIELTNPDEKYTGMVIRINSKFTTLLADDTKKEITIANQMIQDGKFTIIKDRNTP